jgi:hypothetical protein
LAGSFDSLDEALRCVRSLPDTKIFMDGNGFDYKVRVLQRRQSFRFRRAGRFGSLSDAIRYAKSLPEDDVYILEDKTEFSPDRVWEKLLYPAWVKERYAIWGLRRWHRWRQARFKDLYEAIKWVQAQRSRAAVITDENQGRRPVWVESIEPGGDFWRRPPE